MFRVVIVKVLDCRIMVSEFELQSRYYVHFRTNTLGKGMNPVILLAMGYIVPLLFFWVQSLVESYQRLLKWCLIPPCLTLSNIRYVSRVKWINPWKGEAPSHTPRCSSYCKGSLLVALDYGCQLLLTVLLEGWL